MIEADRDEMARKLNDHPEQVEWMKRIVELLEAGIIQGKVRIMSQSRQQLMQFDLSFKVEPKIEKVVESFEMIKEVISLVIDLHHQQKEMRRSLDSLAKLEYFANPLRMRINVSVNCAIDRFIYKLQNFVLPFLTTHYIVLCLTTMKGLECAPFSVRLPAGLVTRVDIWKYDTPFACMKLDS